MTDTDRARILRLSAYAKIIDDVRAALVAIRDCEEEDPIKCLMATDLMACDAIIALDIATEAALAGEGA